VSFGEMSWLLFGAVLGGAPTYAIPAAITLIARLMRYRRSAARQRPALAGAGAGLIRTQAARF
jgi:hypothetical protein